MDNINNINLISNKFSKEYYNKLIDIQFNELILPNVSSSIENLPSIEKFFDYYNKLFYDIPIEGDLNSHKYIVKKSKEYIGTDQNSDEVDLLLEEINQLRLELLEAREVIDTLTQ